MEGNETYFSACVMLIKISVGSGEVKAGVPQLSRKTKLRRKLICYPFRLSKRSPTIWGCILDFFVLLARISMRYAILGARIRMGLNSTLHELGINCNDVTRLTMDLVKGMQYT